MSLYGTPVLGAGWAAVSTVAESPTQESISELPSFASRASFHSIQGLPRPFAL